jgi:hypothetical protein
MTTSRKLESLKISCCEMVLSRMNEAIEMTMVAIRDLRLSCIATVLSESVESQSWDVLVGSVSE